MRTKVILVILLVLTIVMGSGCQKSSDDLNSESAVETSIVHDSSSGAWFVISTGIAECLSRNYEGSVLHATPGEPVSNIYRTNSLTSEFGMAHTSKAYEAYNGIGQFEEKQENIRGVVVFYPSVLHFVLREDLGVTSIKDFLDRKIPLKLSISIPAGNAEYTFFKMLDYYGYTREDLEEWGCKFYNKGFNDTEQMFADGAIDGCWIVAGAPVNIIGQMGINTDVIMVPIEQDLINHMADNYGFLPGTIFKGSYEFEDSDYTSFATSTMLIVSSEVSEEKVYKVTKAICENADYMSSIHGAMKNFTVESVLDGMSIPLHPGAEKYLKEIGLID